MGQTQSFWNIQVINKALARIAFCLIAVGPLQACLNNSAPISPKTVLPLPGMSSSVSSLSVTVIDGMSEQNAQKLQKHLKTELASQKISLVSEPQKAAFSLKGYGSVSSANRTTTLVNIWDVHDVKGRKVHRIISEETGPESPAKDPWSAVNSTLLAKAAKSLAIQYSAWSRGKKLTGSAKMAKPASATPPIATASIPIRKTAPKPRKAIPPASKHILSVSVAGASESGNTELKRALKSAMNRSGYQLTTSTGHASYRLAVQIKLGAPESGRQSIAIDWSLSDRNGKHIGTIKQRNQVRSDRLNRNWPSTAKGAASAAAGEIIKLMQ